MVAATLTVVAQRARQLLGATPVDEIRLVVPAAWGPRRRTGLRQAAWRAGLGQPELVSAAEAVAARTAGTGTPLRVGAFVAVCDLGAGVEASVLRRGPYGFEVLSVIEDAEAGATAWDAAIAERLAPTPADGGAVTHWPGGVGGAPGPRPVPPARPSTPARRSLSQARAARWS